MPESVFNEGTIDGTDFRIESDTNANMFFVDGSEDAVSIAGAPRTGVTGYAYSGLNIEGTGFKGILSVIENQNDVSGGVVAIGHSRGTSANSNTILQDNDIIGRLTFNPSDGVDFRVVGAEIRSRVESDGSLAGDNIGADLSFWTNDGDAVDAHERMTIMADGNVGIGTTSPVGRLDISQGGYTAGTQAIHFGADTGDNTSRTNSTTKYGVITGEHYTTSEEDIELITYYSSSSGTSLVIGGAGNSAYNAPTEIGLRIASGTTVTSDNAVSILTINGSGATIKEGYPLYAGRGATSGGRILAGHYGQANGDFLAVLSTHYSSGGFIVGYGVEGKEGANGYVSTQDAFNGVRTAMQQDTDGIKFLISAATQVSPGTDVSMTERMRINYNGFTKMSNVGTYIDTTGSYHEMYSNIDNTQIFSMRHNSGTAYGQFIDFSSTAGTVDDNTRWLMKMNTANVTRVYIWSDGDIQNHDNSYGSTSDQRIKQDIRDANSQWDDIKALRIRNFKKNEDVAMYGDNAWEQIGVVAQELEASGMDKLVKEHPASEEEIASNEDINDGDMVKGVKYSVLYMKAVKALQEAITRIEDLEKKNVMRFGN